MYFFPFAFCLKNEIGQAFLDMTERVLCLNAGVLSGHYFTVAFTMAMTAKNGYFGVYMVGDHYVSRDIIL